MKKEMHEKWTKITDKQQDYGREYRQKMKELEREYIKKVEETNKELIELLKEQARERGSYLLIVRADFYSKIGNPCTLDAIWLSNEVVYTGSRVNLFDSRMNGYGTFKGIVKEVRQIKPEEIINYNTVACPFSLRETWSVG